MMTKLYSSNCIKKIRKLVGFWTLLCVSFVCLLYGFISYSISCLKYMISSSRIYYRWYGTIMWGVPRELIVHCHECVMFLKKMLLASVTGNRTLVSRVTGGDTSHYTMTDLMTSLVSTKNQQTLTTTQKIYTNTNKQPSHWHK